MTRPLGIDGKPVPGLPMEEVKSKNKRKTNTLESDHDGNETAPENHNGAERDESQETPYTFVESKRKNRGPREPEVNKRSKKEQLAAKEIIIHGLPTPENKLDKMSEAVLIMETLDELEPKWLGRSKGVIVDMTKDIAFHERIIGHHDGTKGFQPVKIRFWNQNFWGSTELFRFRFDFDSISTIISKLCQNVEL